MIIYIIVAVLSVLLLHFSKITNNRNLKKVLIVIPFIIMFLVSAFRYFVGTDFNNYASWFYEINTLKDIHLSSIGFDILILVLKIFTSNNQWLFIITSYIILALVYKATLNYKDDYDLIIYLFITLIFYFSSFNGIRQWMAIAILMNSLKYIREKKILIYLVYVLVASLFHITALNTIILYFVLNFKCKKQLKIVILIVSIIIFKVINITEILLFITKYILPSYYNKYTITGYDVYAIKGGILPILLCGGMLAFYWVFEKKLLLKNEIKQKDLQFRINLAWILTIMAVINTVNELFCRIALYYIPFVIFLIPDTLKVFDNKSKKVFTILMIILLLLFMMTNLYFRNPHNALPYSFYFFR